MIDLNSRSPGPLSGRINHHIDKAIVEKRKAEPPREYLGASILGAECERQVQYRYMNVAPDEGRSFDAQTYRIFDRGHWAEDMMIQWLNAAGFALFGEDPSTGGQFGFEALDGKVKGHADGIIIYFWNGESPIPLPCMWECKCLGDKGWKKLSKEKVHKAYPHYHNQIQLLMGELGLAQCLFSALNGNTMGIYHEVVPYKKSAHDNMIARAKRVLNACALKEVLPRGHTKETDYRCRYCDYHERCWHG